MAASVTTSPTFSVGAAEPLFEHTSAFDGRGHRYDVAPDGQRFVLSETFGEEESRRAIHVVQNWYEEYRDREQD